MNNNSVKNEIARMLKELNLTSIKSNIEEVTKKAESESLGYETYLMELLTIECDTRRNNRIQRHLKESRLPLEKNLESFEMKRLPPKVIQQARVLLEGGFLDRKENILAFGNPGSGKTHLLCAIVQELIKKGRRGYFTTCNFLVQDMLNAKRDLKMVQFIKKLEKFEALIIDDIGYVQQNREEMEVLFSLLAERYERGSVLITSNLAFSKWEKIFKDPMVTAAAIDRLVHHSVILELNIPSYRMDHAKFKKIIKN